MAYLSAVPVATTPYFFPTVDVWFPPSLYDTSLGYTVKTPAKLAETSGGGGETVGYASS
jgi:hypothetical protein